METNIEKGKGQMIKKIPVGILAIVLIGLSACATQAPDSDAVAIAVEGTMTAIASEATLPPTATPALEISDRVPPRGDYQHDYEVKEEYDKFNDTTKVLLQPSMRKVRKGALYLWISYVYEDKEPSIPPVILFHIFSMNDSWEYLRCRNLAILINDDVRINPQSDHEGLVENGAVLELVYIEISPEEFQQIVNADKVELKLCNDEWALTASEMEALKDVASRMSPKNDQDGVDL